MIQRGLPRDEPEANASQECLYMPDAIQASMTGDGDLDPAAGCPRFYRERRV